MYGLYAWEFVSFREMENEIFVFFIGGRKWLGLSFRLVVGVKMPVYDEYYDDHYYHEKVANAINSRR